MKLLKLITNQPPILHTVFWGEFLFRYTYWAIQSTIILYFVQINHELQTGYVLFGAFSFLSFIVPIAGGLSRQLTGASIQSILFCSMLLMLGGALILLLAPSYREHVMLMGFAAISCGAGLYLPNTTLYLSEWYNKNAVQRIPGFTYIYLSSNLGALLAPIISGCLMQKYHWSAIFIPIVVGNITWLLFNSKCRPSLQLQSSKRHIVKSILHPIILFVTLWAYCYYSLIDIKWLQSQLMVLSILIICSLVIIYLKASYMNRLALSSLISLSILIIIFYTSLYQIDSSLLVFIKSYVPMDFFHIHLPASFFVAIEPAFIILFCPLIIYVTTKYVSYFNNPNLVICFATALGSFSFLLIYLIITWHYYLHALILIVLMCSIIFLSMGDILIIPAFNTLITLYPQDKIKGFLAGISSLPFAFAGYLSSIVAIAIKGDERLTNSLLHHFSIAYLHIFITLLLVSMFVVMINSRQTILAPCKEITD